MTQSLKIDTGEIRLAINDDPNRIIVLRPSDAIFAEKFYRMLGNFKAKFGEYQTRAKQIEAKTEEDEHGIPLNMAELLDMTKEVCQYTRDQIDELIGNGTSQIVFGDTLDIDVIMQFFDGIQPFMQKARTDKVARYTNKPPKRK